MTSVGVHGVRKVFPGGHVAVDRVDLEIADGERFVIVGASGCGKTTLLRMIAGFETPTEGWVSLDGRPADQRPIHQRNLAMLFQTSALYPHLTVRQNLGFPLKMAGWRWRDIERSVREAADLLGVGALLDLPPRRLSGGQRQRVAIGRALIRRPAVLLMDEPMSNLDAKLRTELRGELAHLLRSFGTTTVYVTHDQVEAMALGDRIALMHAGRFVQVGSPIDLYRSPGDLLVASFVGDMNLLAGHVCDTSTGRAIRIGSQVVGGDAVGDLPLHAGAEVLVAFRPESVSIAPDGDLTGEVTGVEWNGHEQLVRVTLDAPAGHVGTAGEVEVVAGPTEIVVRTDADVAVSRWQPVAIEVSEILVFDRHDGRRLAELSQLARR